jgi:hypothetical protein
MTSQNTLSLLYTFQKKLGFLYMLDSGAATDNRKSKHHQSMMTCELGLARFDQFPGGKGPR